MAKDPAFLFYTGDFSTGTQFFTDDQVGKYVRLLMAQHQHGHLPEKHMIMICKSYDKDVFSKFIQDSDGLFYNERLEDEINKRKKYSESRGKNRTGKNIISKSYDIHMENKNENKDITINNKVEEILNSTKWIENISIKYKLNYDVAVCHLSDFLDELKLKDDIHKSAKDIKNHFINWLKIQLKNKQNGSNKQSTALKNF